MRDPAAGSSSAVQGPQPKTDHSFYAPMWHEEYKTPIIDGEFIDPKTGQLRFAIEHHWEYFGPPCVDILVTSTSLDGLPRLVRAPRSYPMAIILGHIMRIVEKRKVPLDSVIATAYSIRVSLSYELSQDEFYEAATDMVNVVDTSRAQTDDSRQDGSTTNATGITQDFRSPIALRVRVNNSEQGV